MTVGGGQGLEERSDFLVRELKVQDNSGRAALLEQLEAALEGGDKLSGEMQNFQPLDHLEGGIIVPGIDNNGVLGGVHKPSVGSFAPRVKLAGGLGSRQPRAFPAGYSGLFSWRVISTPSIR